MYKTVENIAAAMRKFVLKKWVIGNDVTFEEVHALSKILGCFRKR